MLSCVYDEAVDWTEILVSISAEDLFMDNEVWSFYKSVADKVLAGDIDAHLQVIGIVRPLDDLLAYGEDFEFGTDDATVMEIEFKAMPEDVLGDNYSEDLLQEYVCACSIRVARDIMDLLPVKTVRVRAVLGDRKLLTVSFDKAIIPSLTVGRLKNRCIPCVYWATAIFAVVTEYSNLFFPFAFFLDGSHFAFGYELIIRSETTGIMKIVCDRLPFV